MRIVFIGAVEFSERMLHVLLEMNANVVGVCASREARGNADHCDIALQAQAHAVPHLYVDDVNSRDTLDWIAKLRPDVLFCFGWSRLLRKPLLELAPLGVVGFHPSALPNNRGRHPIIWTLVLGLTSTGSTFFVMDEGADSGDIISQRQLKVDSDDDARSLYEKIVACASEQVRDFVPKLAEGTAPRIRQDVSRGNVWRKRGRADGQIDWRMPADGIRNLVRALAKPYVGSHFVYRDHDVKVWRARAVTGVAPNIEPGKVIAVDPGGVTVKCGDHAIYLLETEPPFTPNIGDYL
jgi:methionyl-tRNA formyltransferase